MGRCNVIYDEAVPTRNTHEDKHALRNAVVRHEGDALGRRQHAIVRHWCQVHGVVGCDIYGLLTPKQLQGGLIYESTIVYIIEEESIRIRIYCMWTKSQDCVCFGYRRTRVCVDK
jgi:hypothetical protein